MPSEEEWAALNASLRQRVSDVNRYSSQFARLRLWSKGTLIVLSAIVAAGKTFTGIPKLGIWIAVFAIMVAILTAVDAWIQPQEKWRISSTYAAHFDGLFRKVQGLDHSDEAGIKAVESEYNAVVESWLKDTTY